MARMIAAAVPLLIILLPSLAGALECRFDFLPPPAPPEGLPGGIARFEVLAILTTGGNPDPLGAQGWTLGIECEGATAAAIELDGIPVATLYDDDGKSSTEPVPKEIDLAAARFSFAQPAALPGDPSRRGVVSGVILHTSRLQVLLPNGTARVARLLLEAPVPGEGETGTVRLRFLDGLVGEGGPIRNAVTIGFGSVYPALGACEIPVIAGCPDLPDADGDGTGDSCDDDRDGDGVPDISDNCPGAANPLQEDSDGDALGDACDDGDGDGLPDGADNCPGAANPGQEDADGDGRGDACDPILFRRGDADADGAIDISDPISTLTFLFSGGGAPACLDAADADDDGKVDISDPIGCLSYLFLGGPPPAAPGPAACGADPRPEAPDLGCAEPCR